MPPVPGPIAASWRFGPSGRIDLGRPRVMAILNVTPDSFSDGGVYLKKAAALAFAIQAVEAGAALLDIGGESTRPGATRVAVREQLDRILPVIRTIRARSDALGTIPISVDTTHADVAAAALSEGADIINDVSAGRESSAMFETVARAGAGLVLMHRLAPPEHDRYSDRYDTPPRYTDVVGEVARFLAERAAAAIGAGVRREAIVVDPGLGFGKTVEQNLELVRRTGELMALGFPVLSALSRKSFVARAGGTPDAPPTERLPATLALSALHYAAGARLFRVHDIAAHVSALRAVHAVSAGLPAGGI